LGDIENDMVIFPAPTEPTRVRVVDAHDRPIPDVLFTSTRTCAHDVPAFTVRSDALGWAGLTEYGMQDETQELRLRANGFGAIKYLDEDEVFLPDAAPVRLQRRAPVTYNLLDKDGQPWPGVNLMIVDNEGHHVMRTAKDGAFTVASRYGEAPLILYVLDGVEQRFLAEVPIAPDRALAVRDGAEDWTPKVPQGKLILELEEGTDCPIWVCHVDGWLESVSNKEFAGFDFPAGEGFLLLGGPFTGWERTVVPFELTENATLQLDVKPKPEPRIRVLAPEVEYSRLWIQAANESRDGIPIDGEFSVPAASELCVIYEMDGEVRRRCIATATEGMVIDLRPDDAIVRSTPALRVSGRNLYTFPEGAELYVASPVEECVLENSGPGSATVIGPIGTPYLLQLSSDGCVTTWTRGRIGAQQTEAAPQELQRVPHASLEITAPPGTQFIGFEPVDFEMLAPGPLGIVAELPTGQRVGLQLQLEPGAERRIELRASGE
jgi:hypothetical protein